jgi:hypothetical protein
MTPVPQPSADCRSHSRKPWPAADQRRQGRRLGGQQGFGALHLALLIEIRFGDLLMQFEGNAGSLQDVGAIDDPQIRVHPQPQAFEDRREMPGVDQLPVDRGLPAHRVEAGTVEEGMGQRSYWPANFPPARIASRSAGCGSQSSPSRPQTPFTSEPNDGRPAAIDAPALQTNRTLPRCCSAMRSFGISGPKGTNCIRCRS